MNAPVGVLLLLAVLSALASAFVGVNVAAELRARGRKANPLFIRWMIFKYMADYKRMTLEETGRVGPLYRACSTLALLAVVFVAAALIIKSLG